MHPSIRLNIATSPPIGGHRFEDRVRGAGSGAGRRIDEQRGARLPEAQILSFHVAERGVDPERGQLRIALRLGPVKEHERDREDDCHRDEQDASLLPVADHAPERKHQGDRQHELAPVLNHVRPDARIFERMGGIGVEESAAVVADQLDRLLAGDRPDRDDLLRAFKRRRFDRTAQGLRHAQRREANATTSDSGSRT